VELEVTPEPSPEEWKALLQALAALNGQPFEPPAWWQAGAREALDDDDGGTVP
jgi:hypothetical protein